MGMNQQGSGETVMISSDLTYALLLHCFDIAFPFTATRSEAHYDDDLCKNRMLPI